MTMHVNPGALSVEVPDDLARAIAEARARACKVYEAGRNTLIDRISTQDWKSWDASDEMALVSDPDGIGEEDFLDDDCELDEAA